MKQTILLLAVILYFSPLKGQDYHFSQFEMAPLYLNPAKTGLIDGNHRAFVKVRDQWSSVLGEHAYKTAYFSYDLQACLGSSGHFFGFGITGLYDQVGTHAWRTFSGNVNFSYHHKLSRFSHMAAGLQLGVISYALGDSDFTFDEQFGPLGFDAGADNFEQFERLSTGLMPDLSPSILYYNTHLNIQVGVAAFHVNQPAYSFLESSVEDGSRINTRIVFHSSIPVMSKRKSQMIFKQVAMVQKILPAVMYWQFLPSAHWKQQLGSAEANHVSFGIGTRMNRNMSKEKPLIDAMVLSAKLKLHPFSIGVSYDVNTSPLAQVSLFRSGPELSLSYIFDDDPGCVYCSGF